MARIPDEEIERLKKEVALERLVLGFGNGDSLTRPNAKSGEE